VAKCRSPLHYRSDLAPVALEFFEEHGTPGIVTPFGAIWLIRPTKKLMHHECAAVNTTRSVASLGSPP
jgi:hypothetical protein